MENRILQLTKRQQLLIGCGLALLMTWTRGLPLPGFEFLPGASWAIFFLAGVYIRSILALPLLLALAVLIDGIAVGWAGVSAYCLTPAYALLAPAYASLWLVGHGYATRHSFAWRSLMPLVASVFLGVVACELFSSGGFYLLSGAFNSPSLGEFQSREWVYFPGYLATTFFWVGMAAVIHVGIVATRNHNAAVTAYTP